MEKSLAIPAKDFKGGRIWVCPMCDFSHKKSTGVFRHINIDHTYYCEECLKFFKSPEELARHTNGHEKNTEKMIRDRLNNAATETESVMDEIQNEN